MAPNDQLDLFKTEDEAVEVDEDQRPRKYYYADPDKVRVDLHKILAEARAAQTMPWDSYYVRFYCTVFPQMTNWLPADEAAQLRSAFATEMARLKMT